MMPSALYLMILRGKKRHAAKKLVRKQRRHLEAIKSPAELRQMRLAGQVRQRKK